LSALRSAIDQMNTIPLEPQSIFIWHKAVRATNCFQEL
jgi:hypothetical protein